VTVLTPFPGTALHRRLRAEGRPAPGAVLEALHAVDVNFVPAHEREELEQGLEYLFGVLYTSDEVRRRRLLYLQAIRCREAAS